MSAYLVHTQYEISRDQQVCVHEVGSDSEVYNLHFINRNRLYEERQCFGQRVEQLSSVVTYSNNDCLRGTCSTKAGRARDPLRQERGARRGTGKGGHEAAVERHPE